MPQWANFTVAEAAGYHSIGDGLTGFEHFIKWDLINDDVSLDPDHPESLVYQPQPDGSKKLVSAMYFLPESVDLKDVPNIGGALMQWHIHDNLCFINDPVAPLVRGVTDANGGCPAPLASVTPRTRGATGSLMKQRLSWMCHCISAPPMFGTSFR